MAPGGFDDISQPIRLGLIGGGLEPAKALRLVRDYVEAHPLMQNVLTATAILGAAILGVPEEDGRKKKRSANRDEPEPLPRGKVRFAGIYGAGAALGFTPQEVDAMSLWQLNAAVDGYVMAHGSGRDRRDAARPSRMKSGPGCRRKRER